MYIYIGFCDENSDTPFTRRNPAFRAEAKSRCEVTCEVGCGAPNPNFEISSDEL